MIDALDECDPAKRDKLLDALEDILEEAPSLVKIFVSSRNDQDIVSQLRHYPNLAIDSDRNGGDITEFVRTETNRLIEKRKLLKYSHEKAELTELITGQISKEADGM